ncbi:hypothetical protein Q9233_014743 [Columba guinea]|nr:hypothetical protein Q9233_014743 [Columba guinea]
MGSSIFPLCLVLLLHHVCGTPVSVGHLSSEAAADADVGEISKDIPEINLAAGLDLFQGDIMLPKNQRNALRNETYRWKFPVPYILSDNLGNADT